MKKIISKTMLPGLLVVGSLGLMTAVVSLPAGAASKAPKATAVAAKTFTGKVSHDNFAKRTFTLTSGRAKYTVHYSVKTNFTKGSAANLKTGASVSVTGKLLKTVIQASSISA